MDCDDIGYIADRVDDLHRTLRRIQELQGEINHLQEHATQLTIGLMGHVEGVGQRDAE